MQEQSGEIWGQASRYSNIPSAKAYKVLSLKGLGLRWIECSLKASIVEWTVPRSLKTFTTLLARQVRSCELNLLNLVLISPSPKDGSGVCCTNWRPPGWVVLADKGYQGSAHAKIPYKGKNIPESQKIANHALRGSLTWRAVKRPAQGLAHPPQAPLLPLPHRTTRQGHPRPANPRGKRRMKKARGDR
jgi:hypothetical protein